MTRAFAGAFKGTSTTEILLWPSPWRVHVLPYGDVGSSPDGYDET
jgi:hypothetical protein